MTNEDKKAILLALNIGRDAAYEAAERYHQAMKGYRRKEHELLDADVALIDGAIELLSTIPVTDTKPSTSYYDACVKIMG